jgi:hypothetical protein
MILLKYHTLSLHKVFDWQRLCRKGSSAIIMPKAASGDDMCPLQVEGSATAAAQTVFDGMVRASWLIEHFCSGTPTLTIFSFDSFASSCCKLSYI